MTDADRPADRPEAELPSYDVLVVGGTGIDTIVRVDELALPGGDSVGVPPIRDYAAHTGNGVVLAGSVSGAYACGSHGTHEELISAQAPDAAIARARYAEPAA